ncbi:hypothetical protein ABT264_19450 [Streptomyces virginiae]|uniref:hypothetical protein n=1 Tax=Streptomyces virginiae TaxID=1961 RepID=UPI00331D31A4
MSSRILTVAHQQPGECAYCDEQHARIVAAVARELADKIRARHDEAAAEDWGRSRGKRTYLSGISLARKLIEPKESP